MPNQKPFTSFLEAESGRKTAGMELRELLEAMSRQNLEALQRQRERLAALRRVTDAVCAAKMRELMIASAGSYHTPASSYYHTSVNCRQGSEISMDRMYAGAGGKFPCMSCLIIRIAPPNLN